MKRRHLHPLAIFAGLAATAGLVLGGCGKQTATVTGSHSSSLRPMAEESRVQAAVHVSPRPATRAAMPALHFFSSQSFWNAPVGTAAVDPESTRIVAAVNSVVQAEVASKFGPWISTIGYSTPIYTVPGGQRTVRVELRNNNPALQRAFAAVPLPAGARPASGSDAQLTIWQPSRDRLWEFWRLGKSDGKWHAKWGGAMRDVSHSPGYFSPSSWPGAKSNWGASATSLPLVGGLITLDDLRRGEIDHALALGFPLTQAGVVRFPAQRTDGKSSGMDAVAEGTRLRLDPQVDLASLHLPPLTAMIARAAQRYGMVVRDTSGVVDFYGQDPSLSSGDPFRALYEGKRPWQLLALFPWSRLQAVAPPPRA
jgi:hypothetical protein